jgi:bifunctional non-homologous end joining protein LigD
VLPRFEPMPLAVLRHPIDHPEWSFELNYDDFRALAYIEAGECRLVSRKGNTYRSFAQLASTLAAKVAGPAILDGEIVCLDGNGAPQFYDLMRRQQPQHFAAFDLLWHGDRDLRTMPLLERKRRLKRLLRRRGAALYVEHVPERGCIFYATVCAADLEGIVAKRADGLYAPDETSWVKIKNPRYSQWDGRRDLFDRKRAARA